MSCSPDDDILKLLGSEDWKRSIIAKVTLEMRTASLKRKYHLFSPTILKICKKTAKWRIGLYPLATFHPRPWHINRSEQHQHAGCTLKATIDTKVYLAVLRRSRRNRRRLRRAGWQSSITWCGCTRESLFLYTCQSENWVLPVHLETSGLGDCTFSKWPAFLSVSCSVSRRFLAFRVLPSRTSPLGPLSPFQNSKMFSCHPVGLETYDLQNDDHIWLWCKGIKFRQVYLQSNENDLYGIKEFAFVARSMFGWYF